MARSVFKAGDRVRLNLPGSKLHGVTGTLKAPRPPAGWWLVVADSDLEQPEGQALSGDDARTFIAPDLWLEAVGPLEHKWVEPPRTDSQPPAPPLPRPQGVTAGVRGEALPPPACGQETRSGRRCTRAQGHLGRHSTHGRRGAPRA